MTGICLCNYSKCPKSNTCLRFLEKRTEYSSFAEFQNICDEQSDYEYYWRKEKDNV